MQNLRCQKYGQNAKYRICVLLFSISIYHKLLHIHSHHICVLYHENQLIHFIFLQVPWNRATLGLPLPLLVVRIRASILLASHSSTKIWAVYVVKRIGLIINPFTNREVTFISRIVVALHHVHFIIFFIEPWLILQVKLR